MAQDKMQTIGKICAFTELLIKSVDNKQNLKALSCDLSSILKSILFQPQVVPTDALFSLLKNSTEIWIEHDASLFPITHLYTSLLSEDQIFTWQCNLFYRLLINLRNKHDPETESKTFTFASVLINNFTKVENNIPKLEKDDLMWLFKRYISKTITPPSDFLKLLILTCKVLDPRLFELEIKSHFETIDNDDIFTMIRKQKIQDTMTSMFIEIEWNDPLKVCLENPKIMNKYRPILARKRYNTQLCLAFLALPPTITEPILSFLFVL